MAGHPLRTDLLRQLYVNRGLTIEELAAEAGIHKRVLERALSRGTISTKTAKDIAAVLEIPVGELLDLSRIEQPVP